jgi:hypothetical protein
VQQAGGLLVRVSQVVTFFNLPHPSSRIMVFGLTRPVTEMPTSNHPGGKGRPAGA